MSRSTTSLRLDDALRERLALMSDAEGISLNSLVERMLREAVAMEDHPGIFFQSGPAGRRAVVSGACDVWEIMFGFRRFTGSEAERIAMAAEEFGVHPHKIEVALDYAAAHWPEIEARIIANDRAYEEYERKVAERKRLLA